MYYDYGKSMKKEQEALEAVVRMRKNLNDSKAHKPDFGFLVVLAVATLASFHFKAELTQFATNLHNTVNGVRTCSGDSVRSQGVAAKAKKSQHGQAGHKLRSAMKSGRHSRNA